jgi:PRC-barrel domain
MSGSASSFNMSAPTVWVLVAMLLVDTVQVTVVTQSRASQVDAIQTQVGDRRQAGSVLGIEVRSAGKTIGRVVDLLARPDGSIEAAIIEYGGFLGIGARKVAIPWRELRFEHDGQQLVAITNLTADQLRTTPEYKDGSARSTRR